MKLVLALLATPLSAQQFTMFVSGRGATAALTLRHYLQACPPIYAELSSGPMWSEKQVPAATSQLNFPSQAGIAVTVRPSYHNPGINFTVVVMGVRFRPERHDVILGFVQRALNLTST